MASNKMVKPLFMAILLVFLFTLSDAVRREPEFSDISPMKTQFGELEMEKGGAAEEVNCEGLDEDECLMRRTLIAQIDYIYTQKQKPT